MSDPDDAGRPIKAVTGQAGAPRTASAGISRAAAAHLLPFDEVWIADFEFIANPGCQQDPVCCVAREAFTGREIRLWRDDLRHLDRAPWDTGPRSVTVAYFASAEFGCFRALGWPDPVNVIDLFAEFRCLTNGLPLPLGRDLLGALAYYGLSGMSAGEKQTMRELIMSGGPWTASEKVAILDYCAEDVDATMRLLDAMAHQLAEHPRRIGHAVIRGRYMAAVAAMEHSGIPIDVSALTLLKACWFDIQDGLIRAIDRDFGVYDGRTFKVDRFAAWLAARARRGPLSTAASSHSATTRSGRWHAPIRRCHRCASSGMHLAKCG